MLPALPVIAILALTAIWGYTFVPVKDAVALYPVLAFLGVRFLIATGVLGVVAAARLPRLGRRGWLVGGLIGVLLAASLGLQTAGLERTTVSSTGFITGLYVVLTPLFGLLLFRHRIGLLGWVGAAVAVAGLALIAGAPGPISAATGSSWPAPARRRCRSSSSGATRPATTGSL